MKRFVTIKEVAFFFGILAFVAILKLTSGCAAHVRPTTTPATLETASVTEKAPVEDSDGKYMSFTGPFRIAVAYDHKGTCNPEIRAEKSVEDLLTARGVPPYDVRAFARPDSSVCSYPHVAEGRIVVAYKGDLTDAERKVVEETMSWLKPTPVVPAKTAPKSKPTPKKGAAKATLVKK